MNNHYRILGVDPQAEALVIRGAYLALIRRYHPDKGGDEADAARAQEITAAWDVLRDPTRRAAYDEARQARFQPGNVGGAVVFGRGPRVRGGAAGRNLFLALAAGTLILGWWALEQPRGLTGAQPGAPVKVASKPMETVEPALRPRSDERAVTRRDEPEPLPRLPDVRSEPDVEVAVVLPPLPVTETARMPVRSAEAPARSEASRRPVAAEREQPAAEPVRRRSKESRTKEVAASTAASARVDLAPLERHLQLLTDQSLKYGTEAKRSRLFSTREGFLNRLRDCGSDACRRDAYLRRNAEVGEIMRNQ
jgi:curved DNA-binding protein CbpA